MYEMKEKKNLEREWAQDKNIVKNTKRQKQ